MGNITAQQARKISDSLSELVIEFVNKKILTQATQNEYCCVIYNSEIESFGKDKLLITSEKIKTHFRKFNYSVSIEEERIVISW